MPVYRQLRIKWSVFHHLLRLTDERLQYGTPCLPATLRRRRELLIGYSDLLRTRGFVPGRYAPEVFQSSTLDERALIQRWKQCVQERACARLLVETLQRRRLSRIARVVFDGWRTGIGPRQRRRVESIAPITLMAATLAAATPLEAAELEASAGGNSTQASACPHGEEPRLALTARSWAADHVPGQGCAAQCAAQLQPAQERRQSFAERRADADLKVAQRTIIAGWRGALTRIIQLRQTREEKRLKKSARHEPT